MALQAQWAKVNVTNPDTGEDYIVHRGAYLPDWVDDYTKFVLTTCGAVQDVPDASDDEDKTSLTDAEPVRLQEHPPPAQESSEPSGDLEKPSKDASKQEWVDYASDPRNPNRIAKSTAGNMSQQALMDRFSK